MANRGKSGCARGQVSNRLLTLGSKWNKDRLPGTGYTFELCSSTRGTNILYENGVGVDLSLLHFSLNTAGPLVHRCNLVGKQRPDYIRSNLTLLDREPSRAVLQKRDVIAPDHEI